MMGRDVWDALMTLSGTASAATSTDAKTQMERQAVEHVACSSCGNGRHM